ncbi:MAG: acyl-CoA/acyl-ACP dehydrogenase [Gammaproteobacteria bacterium]|nr:acyl-CoA/acyl-ACP dehydrogenase [Gammaproteobacteria bacterium]
MDLKLDDSQRLLVDSAREFLRTGPDGRDAGMPDVLGVWRQDLDEIRTRWQAMADLGWCGLLVEERHGGIGAGAMEAVLLMEQMGLVAHQSPYLSSALVAATLLRGLEATTDRGATPGPGSGQAMRIAELLSSIARGSCIATVACDADGLDWQPRSAGSATAVAGRLSGQCRFVRDLQLAEQVLLICSTADDDAPLVLSMPAGALLERSTPLPTLSGEVVHELRLDGLTHAGDDVLGRGPNALHALRKALTMGALGSAAEMVGLAQRVLDIGVEHARTRVQSGQPIGAFQAIAHRCADMLRNLEGARLISYRAAWHLDQDEDGARWVAMAKAYASDATLDLTRHAHQVLGAIGYCEEHPLHRLHKRIHAAAVAYGDSNTHLDTLCAKQPA